VSTSLDNKKILEISLSYQTITERHLDLLHGCYLQLEQDSQNFRIKRVRHEDIFYLQQDMNHEMRVALKQWKMLWMAVVCTDHDEADPSVAVDLVHLQWTSRTINQLQGELSLLSATCRCSHYIPHITTCRIEVPKL
jgi:hypothetical protein